jgi:hypothetical protein
LLQKSGAKGLSVRDLIRRCGKRSPARIYDLRADGHSISTNPSRGPKCRYVLETPKKVNTKKGAKKK